MKRLLLLGGGHAQLAVLTALAKTRPQGLDVVLLSPSPWQYYSGMLPGWMAGHYTEAECRIDLRPLAAAAGAHLVIDAATGLDANRRCVRLGGGDTLSYDLLSLDVGSDSNTAAVDEHPSSPHLAVKPLPAFFLAWPALLASARAKAHFKLGVVGGGAAGVELALAAHHAFQQHGLSAEVVLLAPPDRLLPGHADTVRQRVLHYAHRAGLTIIHQRAVGTAQGLMLADGRALNTDCNLIATGARPLPWLADSGLACITPGWVEVDTFHRSRSHPDVFAAGDTCARTDVCLARSGVQAVRAGPVLAHNLLATLSGAPLRRYNPKARSLYLIACGPRHAIASWGGWSAAGHWVWRWKDWIDRSFIRRYCQVDMRDQTPM